MASFNMPEDFYWSSSPNPDNASYAYLLEVYDRTVTPDGYNYRMSAYRYRVRCLKNSIFA